MNTRRFGIIGEKLAQGYLINKGYEILETNFYTKRGEIDIIAKKNNCIIFVEVKTRSDGMMYSPADAVDFAKRSKIISTAQIYLKDYDMKRQPRFDIIEVYFKDEKPVKINHIENAFNAEGK